MKRNGFCFLCDKLPTAVSYGLDRKQSIYLDTRACRALSCILYARHQSRLPEGERDDILEQTTFICNRLLGCRFAELAEREGFDPEIFVASISSYLAGAPSPRDLSRAGGKELDLDRINRAVPDFDFVQDSGLIVAAFWQTYGMALEEVQSVHWWVFCELLAALPSYTTFSQVRQIRTAKPAKGDSPESKARLAKAKRAVRLIDQEKPSGSGISQSVQGAFDSLDL